jgi:hypothetical protein
VSSLLAEKATMQESALERITALEAANLQLRQVTHNNISAGETALQNELAAMTARYEVSQRPPCGPLKDVRASCSSPRDCVVLGVCG